MWHPPEILFTLAGLPIRTYGVMLAVAITLGFLWAQRRAKHIDLPKQLLSDVLFWTVIGGLIGARLGFVVQEFDYFWRQPMEILALWQGGLSFHGGLVGGLLGGLITLALKKQLHYFWTMADITAAPLLLGAIIGRLGNWANQELYGYPTTLPWAITIDSVHRLPGYENFSMFHPTFAYEMLLNLLGIVILIFLFERKRRLEIRNLKLKIGESFLFALAWYSLARFITEIWRIGDRLLGPLSLAQLISLTIIFIVTVIWLTRIRQLKKSHRLDSYPK